MFSQSVSPNILEGPTELSYQIASAFFVVSRLPERPSNGRTAQAWKTVLPKNDFLPNQKQRLLDRISVRLTSHKFTCMSESALFLGPTGMHVESSLRMMWPQTLDM